MRHSFDEMEIGHTVITHSRTITEADVVNFAGVSGDFNPLHLSESAGRESTFDGRVVHGALLFSICTGLLWQHRHERPETVAFYGVDALRFVSPVELGSTVSVEATLIDKQPKDHPVANGLLRYETELFADGNVALTAELLSLVR